MVAIVNRVINRITCHSASPSCASSQLVLDHETYVLNLTEAQTSGEAHWERLYSARDAYGMAALTPADWQDLAERMAADRSLFDVYYK